MPRILVIQHEDGTGPEYLGTCLADAGLTLDLVHPYRGQPLPGTLNNHDGLVVLGGTQSPFDDAAAPWLAHVRILVRLALDRQVPMLGVCLGGELLADVAGGQVTHAGRGPEVGLHRLGRTPATATDPVLAHVPDNAPAVEWHWEEIHRLPPGAVPLLSSDLYPHQAFRVGDTAWGLQFHPEVLTDTAALWAAHETAHLATEGRTPQDVIDEVTTAEPELRRVWGQLARRWAAVVDASPRVIAPPREDHDEEQVPQHEPQARRR